MKGGAAMLDTAIVLGYIVLLVALGLRGGKGVKNAADFTGLRRPVRHRGDFRHPVGLLCGRRLLSGNAAKAFSYGISTTLTLLGFSLGMVLIGRFLVPESPASRGR